jgi:hypothetical protein
MHFSSTLSRYVLILFSPKNKKNPNKKKLLIRVFFFLQIARNRLGLNDQAHELAKAEAEKEKLKAQKEKERVEKEKNKKRK